VFVTIEGPDGAGKSTLAQSLRVALTARGHDVLLVREPGGTMLGEALRTLLLDPASQIDPPAEALLYAAARAQLVAEVVRPALADGRLVLCDRYVESSLAYQGAGRGLGVEAIRAVNEVATGGLRADRVILLDIAPGVAADRALGRPDRIEAEGGGFRDRLRSCFLALAEAEPDRFSVIDGALPPAEVLRLALEVIPSTVH
jgi:dTMP kinase